MTTARSAWLALLGHPVAHSRSPSLMTRAFDALGLDAVYVACDVAPGSLADAVRGLDALGARGANVTVPHKVAVMDLGLRATPTAARIGAANVLARDDAGWVADNTDAPGFVRSIEDAGRGTRGVRAVVLGAGGAARAVGVGLAEAGAAHVSCVGRRQDAVAALIARVRDAGSQGSALDWHDTLSVGHAIAAADLVVQATQLGMSDTGDPSARAQLEAWAGLLRPGSFACDLVYAPVDTGFLRAARRAGASTVDGLGMLAWQAALAVERWFGVAADGRAFRHFLDDPGNVGYGFPNE